MIALGYAKSTGIRGTRAHSPLFGSPTLKCDPQCLHRLSVFLKIFKVAPMETVLKIALYQKVFKYKDMKVHQSVNTQ